MAFGAAIKLNTRGYALIALLILVFLYFHFHTKTLSDTEERISLPYLLRTAIQAAETGGNVVVSVKNDLEIESKGKTKEGFLDAVTTADYVSHCAMKHIITSAFPSVKFISEEKNIRCEDIVSHEHPLVKPNIDLPENLVKASDVTIWIDPLDATYEYTEKLYQYVTTMVCVAINGEPVIGVIHKPFNKTTSWAVVGYSHSVDLSPLTTKGDILRKTKVIISRSHSGRIQDVLKKNFENFEVIIAAGAGYKALKVADGSVDAYLHITAIKKWDICAGNAILNALGGKMTTKHGKALTYYNDSDVVNQDGLIATLRNHDLFVNKL